ncbi:2'-5' RNA ligase family protein [Variovorax sp. H27-G14]|uniref:2'-5' RNA ligase family protein n=1 Tax=Variovorax sp. H27-G14 TaxID=3111914 RepID=UPI0038FCB3FE
MAVHAMQRQMAANGLSGRHVPPEYLHATLHWLGDYEGIPHELQCRAKEAGGSVEVAPFGVGFDRIGSLGGAGMGGLVLTGAAELKKLRQLQRSLASAMKASGIGHHIRERFNPHVSLLYCDEHVPREPIAPIRWPVDELVLIDSLVGRSKHVVVGRWPLQSRQMDFGDW